jgi:Ca-activated chloride channel family protein
VPDASQITPPVALAPDDAPNPVTLTALLDIGLPLQQVSSPHHAIEVEPLQAGRYEVRLAAGSVPAERDFVLRWQPATGHMPGAALFSETWGEQRFGLLSVLPPESDVQRDIARELILVVDVSGSMHGESLRQARAALELALKQLRPDDRFNVIRFNDRTDSLFEGSRPADQDHVQQALGYVKALQADGGTEMLPAMRLALRAEAHDDRLRQVVFLTDGAIGNERALFDLIEREIGQSRLFPVGIGSAPNALLMRKAAGLGRGTFSYIGSDAQVADRVAALFRKLNAPVLTDIALRWETRDGSAVIDQAPAHVPDLYADEPIEVAVRSRSPLASVTVSARLGESKWTHTIPLRAGADAAGVHALWARRRIDDLLVQQRLGAPMDEVREAVVDLAVHHQLVSRFTSLVAVDRTPQRPEDAELRSAAVVTRLPVGWSPVAVFGRLPGTATPAPVVLLLGLGAFALAFAVRRR